MTVTLQYPIGRFELPSSVDAAQRNRWIQDIEELPDLLAAALQGLDEEQLDTPYREGGWSVRQVAHHLADSHMNSFIRFKLALTEDQPPIKPYFEERWAFLADTASAPPALSLDLLHALHRRWAYLLRAMSEADFSRTFFHPESGKSFDLSETLGTYSWHGRHHVAHITGLRERMNWQRGSCER